ncbi:MAG TPA: TIR domain-containing protein, partial [Saprospiraceae bacterium]|nr:TIR domain-containing protein [Saprospiraceae bacterium]
ALIYDFGGQDYYHSVYSIFFTNQTQYIVLWNDKSNKNEFNDKNNNDYYYHFDYWYWLGNINYLLKDKDKTHKIALFNQFETRSNYYLDQEDFIRFNIDQFFTISFPNEEDNKYKIADLQRQVVNFGVKNGLDILKTSNYHPLEVMLMKKVAEDLDDFKSNSSPMSRKEFFEAFKIPEKELEHSSLDEDILLSLLHHRGLIYRLKSNRIADEKIWVNPESLNAAIHEKVKKEDLIKTKGIIPQSDIGKFFEPPILAVMLQTQLIFKHEYGSEIDLSVDYILPQYLPLSDDNALYHLATSDIQHGFSLKFSNFLPQGMMSRLICRFGSGSEKKYFYRYEMIFSVSSLRAKVRLKLNLEELIIEVQLVLNKQNERMRSKLYEYLFTEILDAYKLEPKEHLTFENSFADNNRTYDIENIQKSELMISVDGCQFVLYEDLENSDLNFVSGLKFNEDKSTSKVTIARHLFNPFVKDESKTPKKLFISYSSKNTAFMKEFSTHLKPLEREQLITVWVDRMIETGTEWNEEIQKKLEEADMIVYLISPHFIATPYIMDVEVKKGIEFYEQSKNSSKSVKLYPIQLMECNWKRSFGNYQQKLDDDILLKELIIIKDHENHEAWMKVLKDLENIL